jgi:hypothetical protein
VSNLRALVLSEDLDLLNDHLPQFVLVLPNAPQEVCDVPKHTNRGEADVDVVGVVGQVAYHLDKFLEAWEELFRLKEVAYDDMDALEAYGRVG